MKYEIKILGSGNSNGVPSINDGFGATNSSNSKNVRLRTSLYLTLEANNLKTSILIDCSPDFRSQALTNNIQSIDYLLISHQHADHIYGIHDLKSINKIMRKPIVVYSSSDTLMALKKAFYYLFEDLKGVNNDNFYKPNLDFNVIDDSCSDLVMNNISVKITRQLHGNMEVLGFIFDNKIGYIPDFSEITDKELERYQGIEVLLIACTTPNSTFLHASFNQVIETINRIKPKRAFLVHMGSLLDYDALVEKLPNYIEPGYDNLVISSK